MSIILTSGKKSAQKLREGAKKDKAGKPRPKTALPTNSYMPSENITVWNDNIDGVAVSIALRKDTMEVWCNDTPMEVTSDFKDNGSYIDFVVYSHKARIEMSQSPDKSGIRWVLTIDGREVAELKTT